MFNEATVQNDTVIFRTSVLSFRNESTESIIINFFFSQVHKFTYRVLK